MAKKYSLVVNGETTKQFSAKAPAVKAAEAVSGKSVVVLSPTGKVVFEKTVPAVLPFREREKVADRIADLKEHQKEFTVAAYRKDPAKFDDAVTAMIHDLESIRDEISVDLL